MFADRQPRPSHESRQLNHPDVQGWWNGHPKDDPKEKQANVVAVRAMRMNDGETPFMHDDEQVMAMPDEDEGKVQLMHDGDEGKIQPMADESEGKMQPMRGEEEGKVMPMVEHGGSMMVPANVEKGIKSSKGQGSPLPDNVQKDIGGKMGADLSDVRIHTDERAHKMSKGINAKAFTHGQGIYFKNSNYDPSSREGKRLLAHELGHTRQQKGGVQRKVQRATDLQTIMNAPMYALKFQLSYIGGLVAGFLTSLKDMLVQLFRMSIFYKFYQLFTGELFEDVKEMGYLIKNMTWELFKEALSEIWNETWGDIRAYWKKMTSSDPWTAGYSWGWVVGYIVAEILVTIFTIGSVSGAKLGTKLMQWMRRIINKVAKWGGKTLRAIKRPLVKMVKKIGMQIRGLKKGIRMAKTPKLGTLKFADKVSTQKMARHLKGSAPAGKSYFYSIDDAQAVLDAYNSGNYRLIKENINQNSVTIEVSGITGRYVNTNNPNGLPDLDVPTDKFMIQSTLSPKVVPVNPVK